MPKKRAKPPLQDSQDRGMPPLQKWAESHKPAEMMIYREAYWNQISFVREQIWHALATVLVGEDKDQRAAWKAVDDYEHSIQVISTHVSKSICLPVFRLELPDGTIFTMRNNFYDWVVSVNSPCDVEADFMGLFDPSKEVLYHEGFPKDCVYAPYTENKRQFTFELPGDHYRLFTFFWVFAHWASARNHSTKRRAS